MIIRALFMLKFNDLHLIPIKISLCCKNGFDKPCYPVPVIFPPGIVTQKVPESITPISDTRAAWLGATCRWRRRYAPRYKWHPDSQKSLSLPSCEDIGRYSRNLNKAESCSSQPHHTSYRFKHGH